MWLILSRIWGAIKNIFKCCCPTKLNCYSTCCDAELHIENEKKENNEYKETDKRFKVGSLEYSYHNKKTKEINDENENENNNNL